MPLHANRLVVRLLSSSRAICRYWGVVRRLTTRRKCRSILGDREGWRRSLSGGRLRIQALPNALLVQRGDSR